MPIAERDRMKRENTFNYQEIFKNKKILSIIINLLYICCTIKFPQVFFDTRNKKLFFVIIFELLIQFHC
jgi:hypothetical protein